MVQLVLVKRSLKSFLRWLNGMQSAYQSKLSTSIPQMKGMNMNPKVGTSNSRVGTFPARCFG